MPGPITTDITKLFKIDHPVLLAGMDISAEPKLAAAVTNAGGLGVIRGLNYSPEMLKELIIELKSFLNDKNAPFGVDLLLPQIGDNARATNYDYSKGKLDQLIDIVIEEKASLFVSAVGVPQPHVVERIHRAGIPYMNMVGHPRHVAKCLASGVDIICAQGGESGGHTGEVPTSILIPQVVDLCKGKKSPLTGQDVMVVAAGAMYRGSSLAAALMMGAHAIWVGTRFILADEARASRAHQEAVRTAGYEDTVRTVIFTGRPLRVRRTPYIQNWEENRRDEIKALTAKGIIPVDHETQELDKADKLDDETKDMTRPLLMGKVAAVVNEKKPAKVIVDEIVAEAFEQLSKAQKLLARL